MKYTGRGGNHIDFFKHLIRLGYLSIDEQGNVWRELKRNGKGGYTKTHTLLNKCRKGGYIYIKFSTHFRKEGEKKYKVITQNVMAHKLVYEIKKGPITEGFTVNHENGIHDDNRPENLNLLTGKGQIEHATRVLGTRDFFEHKNPNAKMSKDDYILLKSLVEEGKSIKDIKKNFPKMKIRGIESAVMRYKRRKI